MIQPVVVVAAAARGHKAAALQEGRLENGPEADDIPAEDHEVHLAEQKDSPEDLSSLAEPFVFPNRPGYVASHTKDFVPVLRHLDLFAWLDRVWLDLSFSAAQPLLVPSPTVFPFLSLVPDLSPFPAHALALFLARPSLGPCL